VDTLDGKKLQEANVELTRKVVEAAPKKCRLIFTSSVSVYGKKPAEIPADESTEANPDTAYAKSKYEAEKLVATLPAHVILRISTIYGPQFEDYMRVLAMIEKRKMRIIGDGKNRIPFVHVDDAAVAVANAAWKGKGVYVIAGEPLGQGEIYAIAAKALGVPAPTKKIARPLALAMARLNELGYRFGGKRPLLTTEHVEILGNDRAFDCSRARKELGFSPRPLGQGIREMVGAYKARK
jgi:dihydroflavonol-4-reductase